MPSPIDADNGAPPSPLDDAWRRHLSTDPALLARLIARHREKHRRYHTVAHVEAVVGTVIELGAIEDVDDLGAVVAGALDHDAVYEPASPANERASARLARRDLTTLGWGADRITHVTRMIEATKDHRAPPDHDHAVLFDADLSILGAEPADYASYVDAVRAEYRHVDDVAWRMGRRDVLQAFLAREAVRDVDGKIPVGTRCEGEPGRRTRSTQRLTATSAATESTADRSSNANTPHAPVATTPIRPIAGRRPITSASRPSGNAAIPKPAKLSISRDCTRPRCPSSDSDSANVFDSDW